MVRIAVLGGSKGCSQAMVVQGLESKPHMQFKLLVRNPSKVDYTDEQKAKLTLIQGDALVHKDVEQTVRQTDIAVFSIGSAFDMKTRSMVTPDLCRDSMTVFLEVIDRLPEEDRPKRLVIVSTTGLDGMSEVPYLFRPMYRYLLHEPHMDKLELEKLVTGEKNKHIPNWIIVRPSLLTDGGLKGKYRANEGISGYTVSRKDVGHFLLHQCLEEDKWLRKKVVVTY